MPLTTAVTRVASTIPTLAGGAHLRLTAGSPSPARPHGPGVAQARIALGLTGLTARRRQLVAAASWGTASAAAAWRSMARAISTTARPMIESGFVYMKGAPLLRALMAARYSFTT